MADERNPFKSIAATMVTDPRDWAINKRDAWLYGIVLGWDDDQEENAMQEVQRKFGWSDAEISRLKYLHAEFERSGNQYAQQCLHADAPTAPESVK